MNDAHTAEATAFLVSGTFQATLAQTQRLESALDPLLGESFVSFAWWPVEDGEQDTSVFLTDNGKLKLDAHVEQLPFLWAYEAHVTSKELTPPTRIENLLASCKIEPLSRHVEPLPEKDWLEENFRSFQPISVGSFYIYGTHHTPVTLPEGKHGICLDAATAFGSGRHETTASCLALLEYLLENNLPWKKSLDLGCGSGILAIAMALLNPTPVWASDIDLEAVRVTQKNSLLNGVEHRVHALESGGLQEPLLQAQYPFDLIVANILAEPLLQLAPQLVNAVASGGRLILSGILKTQRDMILHAYENQKFSLERMLHDGDWIALLLRKD